jgi:type IV pilus assembly protein PilB
MRGFFIDIGRRRLSVMQDEIFNILLNKKIISLQDVQEILNQKEEKYTNSEIIEILTRSNKISPEDIADAVANYYGLERVSSLELIKPALELPIDLIKRHRIFPVKISDSALFLAMEDPTNIEATDLVARMTDKNIVPLVCVAKDIDKALQKWYNAEVKTIEEIEVDPVEILNSPAVKIVRDTITASLNERASDIHIEPHKNKTVIRFRVNGTLKKYTIVSKDLHSLIVSRIKILAGLDITERRISQDGQIYIFDPHEVDIRVSVMPTIHGEKIVMRILDRTKNIPTLDELGYDPEAVNKIREAIKSPYGMILVTGPTGSGKTTTLYSILAELLSEEINITTIEDPPEHDIPGINHISVNSRMDFASSLRAILRQDPNIIMIGEIRDSETAKVAIQAALTGHLVLSTLHTNSAAGVPVRLVDMGVEPYLIASSLLCVASQRLVRKICNRCVKEDLSDSPLREIYQTDRVMHGEGCRHCDYTGYSGRQAMSEVMPISKKMREAIRNNVSADELQAIAIGEGMTPFRDKVKQALAQGQITLQDAVNITLTED